MALMGGLAKRYGYFHGNGNKGRANSTLLIMVFGAALIGLMMLHKLRENRVLNLLKDKDLEVHSLQFLFQKQTVAAQEAQGKMEEMRAKIYSLKNQKTELNNQIVQMQFMTASLKQDHVVLESKLEKMQNENKILKEKRDISSAKKNLELIALREVLKQKETEIKEMKDRLEKTAKILSVSADDPSNSPVNLTTTRTSVGEDKNEVGKSKKKKVIVEYQPMQESMNVKDSQNSTARHEAESEIEIEGRKEKVIPREKQTKMWDNYTVGENTTHGGASLNDSMQRGASMNNSTQRGASMWDSTKGGASTKASRQEGASMQDSGQRVASMQDSRQKGDNGENNADEHQEEGQIEGAGLSEKSKFSKEDKDPRGKTQSNRNQMKVDETSHDGELLKIGDAEVAEEDHGAIRDGELQNPKNLQDGDVQELSMILKGEKKLEVPDVSQTVTSRTRSSSRSKTVHKKRGMILKERKLEKIGNSEKALRDMELQKDESQEAQKTGFSTRDERDEENAVMRDGQEDGHSEIHEKSDNESLGMTTDTDNQVALDGREGAVSTGRKVRKEKETSHLKQQDSEDGEKLTVNSIKSESSQLAGDALEQKLDVKRHQKIKKPGVPKVVDRGTSRNSINRGKAKDANRNEETENIEVDRAGEQTGETTEATDDIPSILDPQLENTKEHGHESDNEE